MSVTRLTPGSRETVDPRSPEGRAAIEGWYRPPRTPWLRLNLIASVDGSAAGADGTSDTLSNPDDRAILGVLRSLADVVLIGAQTLRAEGYLLPRRSRLAVLTGSGDLTGAEASPVSGSEPDSAKSDSAEPARPTVIVLGPDSAEAQARATLTAADIDFIALDTAPEDAPAAAIRALRERGLASIVCEGGPSLAGQLIAADVVDEICLSTAPTIAATGLSVLGGTAATARRLELTQLLLDDASTTYARWSLSRDDAEGSSATR